MISWNRERSGRFSWIMSSRRAFVRKWPRRTEESIRSIVSLMCQQRREILGGSYFSRKINLQKMQIDFGTITLFRNRSYPRIVRNWNSRRDQCCYRFRNTFRLVPRFLNFLFYDARFLFANDDGGNRSGQHARATWRVTEL